MVNNKNRVIFLDLMRAFAVLMMVQGHTIDTFLADEFRTYNSPFYTIWHTMRGFTAPIFMFTAGVVFTYLLRLKDKSFLHNPRVKKGFKRFLTLLFLGYLLRYPTYKVFDFSDVTQQGWLTFFAVDALHLIGFGILFVMLLSLISEKTRIKDYTVFSVGALLFIFAYPFVNSINWAQITPLPVAAYFYNKTGSLFPLFPWAGYVIAGAVLGVYLAKNPDVFRNRKFGFRLSLVAVTLVLFSVLIGQVTNILRSNGINIEVDVSLVFFRIGIVLLLNSFMSFAAIKMNSIPRVIKLIGRHTLLIYAVHLVLLYGSAWYPGFYKYLAGSFDMWLSLGAAVTMIILMTSMVLVLERIKKQRREKISTVQA